MVVQVGDKVLVYGAGTPWAFAKKIDPVEVGDKVDVVTLSDGTKLAMPKIELDLSEYVWVVPEFDTPFNIGGVPFRWGMMPLGAAVFSLTRIVNCFKVEDIHREWGDLDLSGCLMIILSGNKAKAIYKIAAYSNSIYTLSVIDFPIINYLDWTLTKTEYPATVVSHELNTNTGYFYADKGASPRSPHVKIDSPPLLVTGICGVSIQYKFCNSHSYVSSMCECNLYSKTFDSSPSYPGSQYLLNRSGVSAGSIYSASECAAMGLLTSDFINPNYPDYDVKLIETENIHTGSIRIKCLSYSPYYVKTRYWFGQLAFIPSDCITAGLAAGDKYIIYNPTTKRLEFNDATKSLTASNWQTGGEGAEISSSPVEYVWDGQGYVYLTSSKTTFSTIQFDDLLQVQAVHGGAVRTIPFHLGERISPGGETVSRELTNITSILRAGKNTITLTAKNQDGTKVGFVTAVYVKRNMTAVSL